MSIEAELKLHIAPEHLQKLRNHPFLRAHSVGRSRTLTLHSIYYDTAGLDLRKQTMALRLRHMDGRWFQTLKGKGQVTAGLHLRNEWECVVPTEQLDLDALDACGGKLPHGVRGHLQPIFVTDFTRHVRLVNFEGTQIELCLDSGEIRSGPTSCPISELELELRSGEPKQLFSLALALIDFVPLEVERTSKAEYGYLMFSSANPAPSKGRFPALKKTQSIASALRSFIGACLEHVQANVPGALLKLDEEYLHQVRVGLRRLRVVLAITRRFRADPELEDLHAQVSRLCIELGRSREWDVLVTQTLGPICARLPEHEGVHELLAASEKLRQGQLAGMEGNLASQDFQRLLLRFGAWMYGYPEAETELTLVQFAIGVLDKRSRQSLKLGRAIVGDDAAQLHALRIACKKLRYASEMFTSLFPADKTESYVAALARLQDILGILNDIAVGHRLLDELDNVGRHDTLALIRGWMEHERSICLGEFGLAWKQFAAQKKFW